MNNIINRVWNRGTMVNIEDLRGSLYQNEQLGHTFVISGVDGDGNVVSLSGTVDGAFLRPDNTTVAISGSASGGKAYVTLPANCYDVPGKCALTIYLTADSQKTALYAAVVTVTRTSSDTASPGTTASVVDLVNAINAAISQIPATDTALKAAMAPTYSNTGLYAVGSYAWYNGVLKRCIVPITTAESYTAAHWTDAALGNDLRDLKSALNDVEDILVCGKKEIIGYSINESGVITASANKKLVCFRVKAGTAITASGTYEKCFAFFVSEPEVDSVSYNNSRTLNVNISDLDVPSGCKWIAIRAGKSTNDITLSPESETIESIKKDIFDAGEAIEIVQNALKGKYDVVTKTVPDGYSTVTSVIPTITEGKAVDANGNEGTLSNYNIADFTAEFNKAYCIIALTGTSYGNITHIQLKDGNTVVENVFADANEYTKTYISHFAGTVRVSYRASADFSVNIYAMDKNIVSDSVTIQEDHVYINRNGEKVSTESDYGITAPIELNKGDSIVGKIASNTGHAYLNKTDLILSSFTPVMIAESTDYIDLAYTAERHEYITICCKSNSSSINTLTVNRSKSQSVVFFPEIKLMSRGLCISVYGQLKYMDTDAIRISEPIPVKAGDVVYLSGNLPPLTTIAWTSQDYFNTFSGLPSYIPLAVGTERSNRTDSAIIERNGYIVVSMYIATAYSVKIVRTYENMVASLADKFNYCETKHNYVDQFDFVPNLDKKRTNSILTYRADDKKSSNFMANAVVYPNGEIIGCRAGSGEVVRIANDGTETVLMTIQNAHDWRGVYMDSNLNVYVSPHSSVGTTSMTNTDRGLYRLAHGSNTFTKVIALCHDIYITKWTSNTQYSVGDRVFNNANNMFYICNSAHTSGTSFDGTKWDLVGDWQENHSYSVGDLVRYSNLFYSCIASHTSGSSFSVPAFRAATEFINNDDTIWTMCEDADGVLYAGVYAHSVRDNPAVYVSVDGGITWFYRYNFILKNALLSEIYSTGAKHVHCINYNEYDRCLYAAVGETNTILRSSNKAKNWEDLRIPCVYGQPTYVIGVKDGLLIGSDGHYACGVSKLLTDGKTLKRCGRTAPGFIFNIRRSDITGWLYAFTRIDNYDGNATEAPPPEAITDPEVLESWKETANPSRLAEWIEYNKWASIYYPEDAIRPQNAVMMVSRDDGDTWEVFKAIKCSQNYASTNGFITAGYFRDGECLVGCVMPKDGTNNKNEYVKPYIISEGKKKRTANGFDLTGEIFIKSNSSNIIAYD